MSDDQDTSRSPVHISADLRQIIEEEVRSIETNGGQSTDKLKLYEKWVSELLETIAIMCKHTVELEKAATSSVSKLEQKLQESADATHNFMHSNNKITSTKIDSGLGHSAPEHQSTHQAEKRFSFDIGEPLVRRLKETHETLKTSMERCSELELHIQSLEEIIRDLKSKLSQSEDLCLRLSNERMSSENFESGDKSRLQADLDFKSRELAQETAQRKRLEKRVCKQSEEIKALTQEVASKHDQVMNQEQRNREVHQQVDKLHKQISYQNMLIDSLRKECKKQKSNKTVSNNSSPTMSRKNVEKDVDKQDAVRVVLQHHKELQALRSIDRDADMNKGQDVRALQRRLEESETMLRAKDEIISTMQAAAGPSRSQTLAHIHKMTPDELKFTLINMEKEISEQRTLIGQLQEALISSKNKFDELQRCGDDSYSMSLVGDLSKDLHEARRQLKFYEEHNRDLSLEVTRIRNDKTEAEQHLERIVMQKSERIARTEAQIESLQTQVLQGGDHSACAKQIATLQGCIEQGAQLLNEKNEQIGHLKEKLDEVCRESEEQLKVLILRNATLAQMEENLDFVSKERDNLLFKVKSLSEEVRLERDLKREQFEEQLRHLLKNTEDELDSWKKRYEMISMQLEQKEARMNEMKRIHEEESMQAMAQSVSAEKLAQCEAEVENLRSQLRVARLELTDLRTRFEGTGEEIARLRNQLDLETAKKRESKAEAQQCANRAEEQAKKVELLQKELEARSSTSRAKEDEMKRLLRLSCDNVQHLQDLNVALSVKAEAAERLDARVRQLEAAAEEANRNLELARSEIEMRLRGRLEAAEQEAAEAHARLNQFEGELVLSAERVAHLQGMLGVAQQERQAAVDDAAALRTQLAAAELEHQKQQAELSLRLQAANAEKQHFEKSQQQLEDLCKTLSVQLGGQKKEREKYLRGLKQAAAERSQMSQEARQVLVMAREWLSEHRASVLELRQLRSDRERLLKENTALRHHSRNSPSMLNSWDCGLVDREESGFWSSHWTTQLDEVDQEIETFRSRTESWGEAEEDYDGVEGRGDNGYQSGSSK